MNSLQRKKSKSKFNGPDKFGVGLPDVNNEVRYFSTFPYIPPYPHVARSPPQSPMRQLSPMSSPSMSM